MIHTKRTIARTVVPSIRELPAAEKFMTMRAVNKADAPPAMLAKIVATIGPASDSPDMVRRLIEAGVSVFRFNFSHGDFAAHESRLATVRRVAAEMKRPVACLGDLQGPKIRVGSVPDGGIMVEAGQDVLFRIGLAQSKIEKQASGEPIAAFASTYDRLVAEVEPGHKVLVNDGAIRMLAVERDIAKGELRCRVLIGGLVTSGKGINLPQSDISAPAITDRDWECARWAVDHELDYVALSFVRRAEEVTELKERLAAMAPAGVNEMSRWIPVIAKIEKPQALADLDRIVRAADAIMVARGDLGVEMDIARVPVAQKEIVAKCAQWGKPCIVATQMLETMIQNAMPTRAEASDVANAIFDGADAVMLSAETAMGKHPALVVETMRRIVSVAEARVATIARDEMQPKFFTESHSKIAALAHGAWYIAADAEARAIAVWSEWGGTARYLSQNNFHVPIVAFTSSERAARRMALFGGVTPVCEPPPADGSLKTWYERVDAYLLSVGLCQAGETILLLAGKPLGKPKSVNTVAIRRVGESVNG